MTSYEEERASYRLAVPDTYKYPREIHFVTGLPKTVSSKIRRSELHETLRAGVGAAQ